MKKTRSLQEYSYKILSPWLKFRQFLKGEKYDYVKDMYPKHSKH